MDTREKYHNAILQYFLLKDNFLEPLEKQRLRSTQTPASPRSANIRKVVELPWQFRQVKRAELIEDLFTDITFLEAAAEAGRVADLAADLEEFSNCFPHKSRNRKIFRQVKEAILRDINFLKEHPASLFQCLWNTCWWYDCPEAGTFYETADGPWNDPETRLFEILEKWRHAKETLTPGFTWIRSLRPPSIMLGSPQISVLHGHSGDWTRVLCSPDGNSIVSCNADRTIRIWDLQSGVEKCILTGHTSYVESIDISPDGTKLLSGGADGTFRIWDLNCAGELSVTNTCDSLSWVDCVAWSKHDGRFAVGVSDNIYIWDASGDMLLLSLKGHTDTVRSIGFAPDGSWLASGSDDNTIRIWNTVSGKESAILKGHLDKIRSVCVSPDGRRIASGSGDCTIRIWDALNKTELYVLNGHSGGVECVAYSPDGQMIASGSEDHQIRKWDAENGNCLGVLSGHERSVTGVAFSPDSRTIISGSADRTIRLWNASSDSNPPSLIGHKDVICEEGIGDIAYSPDGSRFVTGGADGTIRIWSISDGCQLAVFKASEDHVCCVSYSPDGNKIASGGDYDGTVQIRDALTGLTCLVLHGHDDTVRCLSFTHDGKRLVTGSNDDTARVWDAENGKEIKSLRQTGIWKVSAVSCSLDDRYMIAGGDIIREFDAGNGSEILVLPERESLDDYLRAVAFSPGRERIICQPDDAEVAIYDRELNDWTGKIEGISDVNAIAGGSKLFPFLVHCRWNGVGISEAASGYIIAWLPYDIDKIVTHRDGRTWIGMNNSQVFHFTLEGIRG